MKIKRQVDVWICHKLIYIYTYRIWILYISKWEKANDFAKREHLNNLLRSHSRFFFFFLFVFFLLLLFLHSFIGSRSFILCVFDFPSFPSYYSIKEINSAYLLGGGDGDDGVPLPLPSIYIYIYINSFILGSDPRSTETTSLNRLQCNVNNERERDLKE